jgi:hypothetical protein
VEIRVFKDNLELETKEFKAFRVDREFRGSSGHKVFKV